jgi:hypothetical protein
MRVSDLSRRTILALVAAIAGVVVITVALLSGTDSNGTAGSDRTQNINPVAPLDPDDVGAKTDEKKTDPLEDFGDPFATGFGGNLRHKVTVRFTANGPATAGIQYRDRKTQQKKTFTGSYSVSRTFKSRFPTVQAAMQIYPPATTGTCTVIIDGAQVSSRTTNKRFGVVVCAG